MSSSKSIATVALVAGGLAIVASPAIRATITNAGTSAILLITLAAIYLVRMILANKESPSANAPAANLTAMNFGTKQVEKDAADYNSLFSDRSGSGDVKARQDNYMALVNGYYNLVTDFYEWGWGKSFHFGRRYKGEDLHASIARHEHYLALRAGFSKGQKVVDVGCGVGGPMRAIARFSGCNVIGINNNAYQISRGVKHNAEAKLTDQCSFRQSDFMKMGQVVADGEMDGAYAIEATCHAPDKAACFRQIFNALKPGGVFVGYEWTMTDNYDANDAVHRKIKKDVEEGDGLPDLYMSRDVPVALKQAGFEVIECEDLAVPNGSNSIPWYYDLKHHGGISNWKLSPTGVAATKVMVRILEALRIAPKGTVSTHNVLDTARIGLVKGGELGLFTPMLFFKAVKPLA